MTERIELAEGRAVLYRGDCLEVLRSLPDGSVDAVITDPPYFLPARHYGTRKEFPRSLADLSILEHFFRDVLGECSRVLSPAGVAYFFCDGQSYPALYAVGYRHFTRMMPLVWDKVVSFSGYTWRHQHEFILFAEKEESAKVPTGDGDILRCRAVKVSDRDHPAEKPVELLKRLVEKSTSPRQTVLDPFAGSGSVGVACLAAGRRFVGCEIEPDYFEIARKRIEGVTSDGPLFAAAQGSLLEGPEC